MHPITVISQITVITGKNVPLSTTRRRQTEVLYKAEVKVTLKKGVLDPQGSAVEGAIKSLGYTGVP
ncbi:MAG TPA: phosphoribosylformylglycinamidine synthase subunit PurS, partial [Symbiobacteriaceae bacterium]|nr:phosphoribosylformylglycinamidine synthase subunit PurS [Symbiobacteriaceae bacterium]